MEVLGRKYAGKAGAGREDDQGKERSGSGEEAGAAEDVGAITGDALGLT
jgi:hypothetical protein